MKELHDTDPMPWGEHKGTPLGEVPHDYMRKLLGQPWIVKWPFVHRYLMRQRAKWPPEERVIEQQPEGFDSFEDYQKWK